MSFPLYVLIAAISGPIFRFVFRLRSHGLEHLPGSGGFVLAANHSSNLDPWPLGLPLFPHRHLRFMAKSELYWWPLRLVLQNAGAFPVRRGEADTAAIATAERLCREGQIVVMFPEGTRRKKGLRKKYEARPRTGAARIALQANVPLVPAAIAGTDRLTRLGPFRIAYGCPIPLDDLRGQDSRAAAQEATDRLMAEIERLEQTL